MINEIFEFDYSSEILKGKIFTVSFSMRTASKIVREYLQKHLGEKLKIQVSYVRRYELHEEYIKLIQDKLIDQKNYIFLNNTRPLIKCPPEIKWNENGLTFIEWLQRSQAKLIFEELHQAWLENQEPEKFVTLAEKLFWEKLSELNSKSQET